MVGGYNLFWITIYKVVDIACFLAMDPCIDLCSRLRVCKIINVRGLDSLGSEAAAIPFRTGLALALPLRGLPPVFLFPCACGEQASYMMKQNEEKEIRDETTNTKSHG